MKVVTDIYDFIKVLLWENNALMYHIQPVSFLYNYFFRVFISSVYNTSLFKSTAFYRHNA